MKNHNSFQRQQAYKQQQTKQNFKAEDEKSKYYTKPELEKKVRIQLDRSVIKKGIQF
jgi:hypothetical protein